MLVNFTFENCLSFKDEYTFTMKKTKGDEFKYINTIETEYGELLKSSIIYGPNAGGKTNFISTLLYMKSMVMYSVLPIKVSSNIEPFKFIKEYQSKPSKLEIEMIISNVEYVYGFEVLNGEINKEWLKKRDKRLTPMFLRKSSNYSDIILYGEFKNESAILEKVSKDALFLSVAKMFNNKIANQIYDWFANLEILGSKTGIHPYKTIEYLQEKPFIKDKILKYLKAADMGIEDFEYEVKDENPDNFELPSMLSKKLLESDNKIKIDVAAKRLSEFNTKHKMYDMDGNALDEMLVIPFDKYQSDGTKKFFSMIGPILKTLDEGGILVIDEMGSKLHCAMVRLILRMFNSLDINKNNAQLICNTHDVLLLEEEIRRDQIWFVEKTNTTASELYCLSDFVDVRKNDNLLKKYLLGMFGAVPFKRGEI